MLYEIRNYHFDPDQLEIFKEWAISGPLPYLSQKMNLVGFWVMNDMDTYL